jgi:hypothetical protein
MRGRVVNNNGCCLPVRAYVLLSPPVFLSLSLSLSLLRGKPTITDNRNASVYRRALAEKRADCHGRDEIFIALRALTLIHTKMPATKSMPLG